MAKIDGGHAGSVSEYTYYMGIRGLTKFLRWRVPAARRACTWSGRCGHTWAIDCSCLMFRAKAEGLKPLTVLASLLVRMRRAGITPLVVFDGKPPAAKAAVIEQRRAVRATAQKEMAEIRADLSENAVELTEAERGSREVRLAELQRRAPSVSGGEKDDVKKFLYACGVTFVTANGEADDVIGALVRRGTVQAVVSTDMDMLARGVPTLVTPETADASVLMEYSLDAVLLRLGLTYDQFVVACAFMGSDYTEGSLEPAAAIDAARSGRNVTERMQEGIRLLRGDGVVLEELLSEKQRTRLTEGVPREPENLSAIAVAHGWPRDWVGVLLG